MVDHLRNDGAVNHGWVVDDPTGPVLPHDELRGRRGCQGAGSPAPDCPAPPPRRHAFRGRTGRPAPHSGIKEAPPSTGTRDPQTGSPTSQGHDCRSPAHLEGLVEPAVATVGAGPAPVQHLGGPAPRAPPPGGRQHRRVQAEREEAALDPANRGTVQTVCGGGASVGATPSALGSPALKKPPNKKPRPQGLPRGEIPPPGAQNQEAPRQDRKRHPQTISLHMAADVPSPRTTQTRKSRPQDLPTGELPPPGALNQEVPPSVST